MLLNEIFGPKPGTIYHELREVVNNHIRKMREDLGGRDDKVGIEVNPETYSDYVILHFEVYVGDRKSPIAKMAGGDEAIQKKIAARSGFSNDKELAAIHKQVWEMVYDVLNNPYFKFGGYTDPDGKKFTDPEQKDIQVPGRFSLLFNLNGRDQTRVVY